MLFKLVPGGFSYLINQNNYNSNWKKILGFRNMQEKLENQYSQKKSTGINLKARHNSKKILPFCQSDDAKKVADKHHSLPLIVVMTQFMRLLQARMVHCGPPKLPPIPERVKRKKIFYFPFRLLTSTRYQIYNVLLSAYVWTGNI